MTKSLLATRSRTQVYTPSYIADYLAEQTLGRYLTGKTVGQIQGLRCLEPACGDGIFLLAMFDHLADFYQQEQDRLQVALQSPELSAKERLALETEQALTRCYPYHIINQHLFGIDFNAQAVAQTIANLQKAAEKWQNIACSETDFSPNIKHGNFLIAGKKHWSAVPFDQPERDHALLQKLLPFEWEQAFPQVYAEGGFDIVLGNPPYLGFNDYSGVEKAYFQHWYPEVYNLKNDLLYYFLYRPAQMVKPGGRLGYIISRFWKEATFAQNLRGWLARHTTLEQLVDFGKLQVFDGATIDTCLITLCFDAPSLEHTFEYHAFNQPHQAAVEDTALIKKQLGDKTASLKIMQSILGSGAWKIHSPLEQALLTKIRGQSVELEELCLCKTGVQTGNDRLFLPDDPQILYDGEVEATLLKPAIKNSHLARYYLAPSPLRLIYSDQTVDPKHYPNLLRYLAPHQAELERRNRYRKAESFPFYQLQWARKPEIFEQAVKLVCPYKAPVNTFALDYGRHYFSTDVIAIVPQAHCPYSPEALLALLNSRLATYYFRSYAKPVGGGQYDYYADPVKKLPVLRPTPSTVGGNTSVSSTLDIDIGSKGCSRSYNYSDADLAQFCFDALARYGMTVADTLLDGLAKRIIHSKPAPTPALERLVDQLVYRLYGLDEAEIELIEAAVIFPY